MRRAIYKVSKEKYRALDLKAYEIAKVIKEFCTNMAEVEYMISQVSGTFDVMRDYNTPPVITEYPIDRWNNRIMPDSDESGKE